ncbi:MAG: uracil-DNA glycosylase [Nitrososphaerota archaeon]|nr:uracil-DNA glycosylase [Candidatus Calditenuaceae archaeon]MDW8073827.1 uracil-DNA glycosylase [Nitrososphaerota archaeon]
MSLRGEAEKRLAELGGRIVSCRLCPRLVKYREAVARRPPKRYALETYWAKPLPGFGDPAAKIIIIGLAPAAHGGNRTGRMFTGDGSGDTLVKALHASGLANIPYSISRDDGLRLSGCYLTASVRCAPPHNMPLKQELENCYRYLLEEFEVFRDARVVVALGGLAFSTSVRLLRDVGFRAVRVRPVFRHGRAYEFVNEQGGRKIWLIATYHPSRRNTQTGLLTQRMLNNIFRRAAALAGLPTERP